MASIIYIWEAVLDFLTYLCPFITCPEVFFMLTFVNSYAATRIFVSSKPIVAQRFIEMVILERVRDDIHETRKLNVHLFNSLKKSVAPLPTAAAGKSS